MQQGMQQPTTLESCCEAACVIAEIRLAVQDMYCTVVPSEYINTKKGMQSWDNDLQGSFAQNPNKRQKA